MTHACPVQDIFFRRFGLRHTPEIEAVEENSAPFNVPSMHKEYLIPSREERLLKVIFPEPVLQDF